ncbi:MAG TPA: hypothetical protein ENI23_17865 [bacterium]|nr:hypothetical protein [bacterium]
MIVKKGKKFLPETHPHLLKEWDYSKNGNLRPENASFGSHKRVWWRCRKEECKHSWLAAPNNRTKKARPRGCPSCSGSVVSDKNRLPIKCPELAKEWDFSKNKGLSPRDISYGSEKKVWWLCSNPRCEYSWKTSVCRRACGREGCPACAGRVATEKTSLASKFSELVEEWDFIKNQELCPDEVTCGSHKKVWWRCSEGHSWQALIYNRTGKGYGCPICSGGSISRISQKWLDQLNMPKEDREYYIKKLGIRVDAYVPETNTVYEFLGNYWHGNPEIFPAEEKNRVTKKTFGALHKKTLKRLESLRKAGYNVVHIWENDFVNCKAGV